MFGRCLFREKEFPSRVLEIVIKMIVDFQSSILFIALILFLGIPAILISEVLKKYDIKL